MGVSMPQARIGGASDIESFMYYNESATAAKEVEHTLIRMNVIHGKSFGTM